MSNSSSPLYLGLTGKYGVGKDTVAQLFVEQGFIHLSLSDVLQQYLLKNNIPYNRDNMIRYGDQLRTEQGADVLSRTLIKQLQPDKKYVFSSIRSLGELHRLQTLPGFILIEVTAPVQIRLHRIQQRNRPGDPQTLPKLLIKEQQEQTTNPNGMQLNEVIAQAKYQIINDSNVKQLREKVKELVIKLITAQ